MTTVNELIEALQALPEDIRNLPVATHANGHTYSSFLDAYTHGPLIVATVYPNSRHHHVVIGNMGDRLEESGPRPGSYWRQYQPWFKAPRAKAQVSQR
jgi:hypothetical protein